MALLEDESTNTVTTGRSRASAARSLTAAGIATAVGDADIIVAHVLGLRREDVRDGALDHTELDADEAVRIAGLVSRRSNREPLQHLTGKAFFNSLELAVGPGVFVPRRETQFVAGLATEALKRAGANPIAVDLGTGAGAIALTMATEVPTATVYGVELAPEAFEWTVRNFATLAPGNAIPVLADMTDALHELDGRVDVVSANPPFIPDGTDPATPEVRLFDPGVALFGGPDGLDLVRAASRTGMRLLRSGGFFAMEHGVSQAQRVAAVLEHDGWASVTTHRDPRGHDRVTTARR